MAGQRKQCANLRPGPGNINDGSQAAMNHRSFFSTVMTRGASIARVLGSRCPPPPPPPPDFWGAKGWSAE